MLKNYEKLSCIPGIFQAIFQANGDLLPFYWQRTNAVLTEEIDTKIKLILKLKLVIDSG